MSDDGSVTYGSNEFEVDLQQLSDAIGSVGASRDSIGSAFAQIKSHFADVGAMWFGPAGQSFRDFSETLASTAGDVIAVLDDVVARLGTAHQNYQDAEWTNVANLSDRAALTSQGSDSGDGPGSGPQPDSKAADQGSDQTPLSEPTARQTGTAGAEPVAASMLTARQPTR